LGASIAEVGHYAPKCEFTPGNDSFAASRRNESDGLDGLIDRRLGHVLRALGTIATGAWVRFRDS